MTELRPMQPSDVPAAEELAWAAMWDMSAVWEHESTPPERTSPRVERGQFRQAHLQRTDPAGAWVAVDGADIAGVALSLRRGPMWFLSLLAVATARQAGGIGRQLFAASLQTATGAESAWLMASPDPKALRLYARAGFGPRPGYAAAGPLDRSLLPGGLGVREGSWEADGELVDAVVTGLRGAPYGPDLGAMQATGQQLLVVEEGRDRGFAVVRIGGGVGSLGATTPALAQRLLWAALAAAETPEVMVDPLTADQQWAIDVAVAARLRLLSGGSICVRSPGGPLSPYLPSGAYG